MIKSVIARIDSNKLLIQEYIYMICKRIKTYLILIIDFGNLLDNKKNYKWV